EAGIRDWSVTGVQTCALPIYAIDAMVQSADLLAAGRGQQRADFAACGGAVRQRRRPDRAAPTVAQQDDMRPDRTAGASSRPRRPTSANLSLVPHVPVRSSQSAQSQAMIAVTAKAPSQKPNVQ